MRLRIEHRTTLTYDQLISEAYTEMRLKPMDAGGQRCLSFALVTEPRGEVMQYVERLGNDVRHFDVLQPHQRLMVYATSEVLTPAQFGDGEISLLPLDEYDYLLPTGYTPADDTICRFAGPHVGANDRETARALARAVHAQLKYESGATDVKTTADDVLALGRGVCQDFAHVLIASCRCQGIPARYVSGYLHDPRLDGANSASHAWADVFIRGQGWMSLDPTHDCEQTEHYVRLAVGRDYADVPPTRGTYKGKSKETLEVQVAVRAL
jgi:transglutaminase-like putative cysteine protease